MRLEHPESEADDRVVHIASCPFTVDRPVMLQRWERLTFLHWSFDPATVQRLLPDNLHVETYDGAAWVGLVPFFMRVTTAEGRSLGPLSNFCETNVRTYVRDHEGRSGVWFFSLDAARLGAVVVARTTYRLPYFWSSMSLVERFADETGDETNGGTGSGAGSIAGTGNVANAVTGTVPDEVAYTCRRRGPGPRPRPASRVTVRVGEPFGADESDVRDHFLTARWIMFSATGSRLRYARAEHGPWPLHRATLLDIDDELVTAAGLPRPEGEPLVHYSPGVDVRIGRPERYASDPPPGRAASSRTRTLHQIHSPSAALKGCGFDAAGPRGNTTSTSGTTGPTVAELSKWAAQKART